MSNQTERDCLLTATELASHIGVTRRTIGNWTRDRVIPYYRVGPRLLRFDLAKVQAALEFYERGAVAK